MNKQKNGLYIHIPFCKRKCAYCDFLSFNADDDLINEYVNALTGQIKHFSLSFKEKPETDSIFIGGGTPSFIKEEYIGKILNAVYESFNISCDCETTIEINPASESRQKLKAYKDFGINRISVGIQSFSDSELAVLKRLHSAKDAMRCLDEVFLAGFENVSADLMFAIPNQSAKSFEKNLYTLMRYPMRHVSAYSLIIEENTPFYDMFASGKICESGEDLYCTMYETAKDVLSSFGFKKYEISNFAKPGYECRHNLKYWSGGEYFAFGLGAVGLFGGARYENERSIKAYIKNPYLIKKTALSKEELMAEYIICSMRKTSGLDLADFEHRFKKSFFDIYDVSKYEKGGFLACENGRIFFTEKGFEVSNSILCDFV